MVWRVLLCQGSIGPKSSRKAHLKLLTTERDPPDAAINPPYWFHLSGDGPGPTTLPGSMGANHAS